MRLGVSALLFGAFAWSHPLMLTQSETETAVSPELLQDIYTYASFSHAAYCSANYDGAIGNLLCRGNSTAGCRSLGASRTSFEFTDKGEVAGYVVADHERKLTIVTFRGSWRRSDVWRNLRFFRTGAGLVCAKCSVHRGFWNAFRSVKAQIDDMILGRNSFAGPGYRIVVTGHSYGGAVAIVVAAYLRSRGQDCDLFTYGSPRVGNKAFADYASRPGRGTTARIINAKDIVAAQPPAIFGFANISPEFWFEKGIAEAPFPNNLRVCRGTDVTECSGQFGLRDLATAAYTKTGLKNHMAYAYANNTTPCREDE